MISFFAALATLLVGYFLYGKVVEKAFKPDDRPTPATLVNDGVDYVPMKKWNIFLIQLLNIAGLGPIFGAISGALWGPVVFFWIVFGSIFAGAVHDYLSGMISMRHNGASISEIVGTYLGNEMKQVMRVFSVILLTLVGVVFMVGPAGLLAKLTPDFMDVKFWLIIVLAYYFLATIVPIDKLIGKIYPIFGITLIIMAVGVAGGIILQGYNMPEISFANLHPAGAPIWPLMFITVACGAISGFHATQSPMMARCVTSEKQGRTIFYGAMIAEGVIALVWAAAGVAFYETTGGLAVAIKEFGGAAGVVYNITFTLLGPIGGVLAMLGVIACPITSGDTAFRSARLTLADWFGFDQKPIKNRLLLAIPLLGIGYMITFVDYAVIWRYFAWSNQTLAMMALWAGAVYLKKVGAVHWIATVPATFMSAVSVTYILQAAEGFKLPTSISYPGGIAFAVVCLTLYMVKVGAKKATV
ncbi:MAG: carbon starvation protein CstA [Firmicutes bacterium GWF2_51_9]|nr:MAG: carbon starvation protein CstA [Firmicutes bacterium GWF2_51_9]OGS59219.1 MAG: carbon starvation protein CstA [Firmicutes bacterium GWE2_51_13]HAM64097.1 carbon starvation protein A [Erysipelotrichaceae bacterium]HAO60362.1 carbon starvation protein A [Erysipelotrichaceae bacterium]HBZ41783.1 carbon starvation protein A [Erysipelotrichaceae bacterium]